MEKELNDAITKIARKHFPNIPTLYPRNRDSLDFHDVSVVSLKDALLAAYQLGLEHSKKDS